MRYTTCFPQTTEMMVIYIQINNRGKILSIASAILNRQAVISKKPVIRGEVSGRFTDGAFDILVSGNNAAHPVFESRKGCFCPFTH